jgi:rare lipoprotein A
MMPEQQRRCNADNLSGPMIMIALVVLMAMVPCSPASAQSFSGVASYYGNESGRRTASGARFDQDALTAAHRSLPFGTRLCVSRGGRSVVVTINDRGPFVRGRVLDLSLGAARRIGLVGAGVGRVTAEVLP